MSRELKVGDCYKYKFAPSQKNWIKEVIVDLERCVSVTYQKSSGSGRSLRSSFDYENQYKFFNSGRERGDSLCKIRPSKASKRALMDYHLKNKEGVK